MATVKEVLSNQEVAEEFFSKETPEEAQAFLQEKGVEISLDEIKEIGAALEKMQDGELSEDDLENVAGGGAIRDAYDDIIGIAKDIIRSRTGRAVIRWFRRW